jgi:DNA-directed RNA polymerase
MINKISSTGFKINKTLFDYIINNGDKHNLLIDPTVKHKFADIQKKSKYQESVYASHNSKVILQKTILGIAEYFSNFSSIYFPVRLDQRGRLYCSPNFLNYQSNELSKSLLLFSEPGIINRDNMDSIKYLKVYGANCFGGKISKLSIESKLE